MDQKWMQAVMMLHIHVRMNHKQSVNLITSVFIFWFLDIIYNFDNVLFVMNNPTSCLSSI